MTERVFNFSAGPATLPRSVMERVKEELLDYQGMGASIIEISHFTPEFMEILERTESLLRDLMEVPSNYKVLFMHGGAQMQFSMIPLNLMPLKPHGRALYVESGIFAGRAIMEAGRYGEVRVAASSADTGFDRIPHLDPAALDSEASYLHITTNNTIMGTRYQSFPDTGDLPLIGDATSEILSRKMDLNRFGMLYAGAQKNLGPSGMAVVILREDLLGHAMAQTPKLLDYTRMAEDRSLTNTVNTFAIYVCSLVLEWVKSEGGVTEMEARNNAKSKLAYDLIDNTSNFYEAHALPEHRATQNITFRLPSQELTDRFVEEALAANLYGVRGHKAVGGIRLSIYNAMPMEAVKALGSFMEDFEKRNG